MNKKKLFIIVGGLCLAAAIGLFVVKAQYESKVRAEIENVMANLPSPLTAKADSIDVSFFNKSVSMTNLKGTYTFTQTQPGKEESLPIEYTIARVHAAGVNVDGFQPGAGLVKLMDTLEFTDTRLTSPLVQATIEDYRVQGISGDYPLIETEITKALPALMAANARPDFPANDEEVKTLMAGLASFIKAYETVRIESASIKNYVYSIVVEGKKFNVVMGSMEGKEYSLRKMGPFAVKDVTAEVDGAPVLAMESFSMEEMVLPSFAEFFTALGENPDPSPMLIQSLFKGQPFAMKNLRIKNLNVRHPMAKDRTIFSLGDSDFSYVAETAHTMDFSLKDLNIDKAVLEDEADLPEEALATLPETLSFEAAVQQVLTPKAPGAYDIDAKRIFFKGAGLGEATLSLAANDVNSMALMMGMPSKAALKSFSASLTDAGFSTVAFAADSAYSERSADQARAETVADMRRSLERETSPIGKEMLSALIQFTEKAGGTLTIAVQPAEPLTFDKLMAASESEPAALGFSVNVTNGQQ